MKYIITSVLLCCGLLLTAQVEVNNGWWGRSGKRVTGNGDVVTLDRNVDGFTGIKACCSFKVELRQSNDFEVRVEAESNLQEFVETEVKGRVLHIKYSDEANFKSTEPIRVYVSLPVLESVAASSSSRVIGKSDFSGEDLDVDVSSSAKVELAFSGDRVDMEASSSGSIELRGSANRVDADASSSSSIDAGDLRARDGRADVSSAARITLHTTQSLRADASSAGSVYYYGSPGDVDADTSSAGKVRSKN